MKIWLAIGLAIFLPANLRSQDALRITEVGLGGRFHGGIPTPVRIHIPAIAQAESIRLEITVSSGGNGYLQTDHIQKTVEVSSGQPKDIELPVLLGERPKQNLHIAATNSGGQVLGEADRDLMSQQLLYTWPVVAIYCLDNQKCEDAQARVAPLPADEESPMPSDRLEFVLLKELRQHWWDYSAASVLILAGPLADCSAEQSNALEEFMRAGGTLVLVENERGNPAFLADYKPGGPGADSVVVGKGRLYRIPNLQSEELRKSIWASSTRVNQTYRYFTNQSSAQFILPHTGFSFTFPQLKWLLTWIGAYILVIGAVNFGILRRLRKLEWGWVTVSVMAVLFAGGLYVASSWSRPRNFTLDSVSVDWMDAHSPTAFRDFGLRVSSPERTEVGVTVAEDLVLNELPNSPGSNSSEVDIGAAVTDRNKVKTRPGLQIDLGPPFKIRFPLLKWSFSDFYAKSMRVLPGTVHWTSGLRLKNDTGKEFREAFYLDFGENKIYALPAIASGGEIDLGAMTPREIFFGYKSPRLAKKNLYGAVSLKDRQALSLRDLIYSGFDLGSADHLFIGLDTAAPDISKLDVAGAAGSNIGVTLVGLD